MKKIFLYISIITAFYTINGCDYSLNAQISENTIYVALHGPDQKRLGFAKGREFPKHIDLDTLYILQENDRKKGYGSKILKEFLSQAAAYDKPVFATASPLGHNFNFPVSLALNGLIRFYQKHGALVLHKDDVSASIVFLHHLTRA
ncbi:MAG: GNAT family N-acetyltransferase [Candidatus Babeliaceae bacterium]|nr:GNAT family N-acetyltransferase [Candidatus Babeliaceae bacterium]